MLAALNHPNICAIYGLEEADGIRFLILERVDGTTLAERIAGSGLQGPGSGSAPTLEARRPKPDRALPVSEALAIARQIVEALEAARLDLEKARDLGLRTASVYRSLGFNEYLHGLQQGRKDILERSIADSRRSLEVDDWNAVTAFNLGVTLLAADRLREAEEAYAMGIERLVYLEDRSELRGEPFVEQAVAAGALTGPPVASPAPGSGAAPAAPAALVNLNTADQVALETLPGVGPVTAAAILQWRTEHGAFSSVDELLEVSGIGDATLAEIAPHVTL